MKAIWLGLGVGLVLAILFLSTLGSLATNIANNMAVVAQAKAVQSQADAIQTQAWALVMSQCISGFILVIGTILSFAGGFGAFYLYNQFQMNRAPAIPGGYGQPYRMQQPAPRLRIQGIPPGAVFLSNNRIAIPNHGIVQLTAEEARELAQLRQPNGTLLGSGQSGLPEIYPGEDYENQGEGSFLNNW